MRTGVIGCGYIATSAHLPILTKHFLVDSVSISDIDEKNLNVAGTRFGVPPERRFTNYEDMLKSDIDAVFILTPTFTHTKLLLDSLDYGKHVFVEKPLCSTSQEAKKIVDKVKSSGLIVGVGYNLRFMPQMLLAKHLLKKGLIGNPIFVSGSYLSDDVYTRDLQPDSFYLSQERGGGVLFDSMCHLLDIVPWIVDSEIKEIKGMAATYDNFPVENTASSLIRLENGLIGCLRAVWAPLGEFLHTRMLKTLEILGVKGYIIPELYAGSVKIYRKGKGVQTILPKNADPHNPFWCLERSYRDQFTAFINAVKKNMPPPVDAVHGAHIVSLIERVRQ